MPRTTIDIDASVLRQVKRLARARRKSLARVVSELLAAALADQDLTATTHEFAWRAKPMGARIDLEDKEAVYAALDRG